MCGQGRSPGPQHSQGGRHAAEQPRWPPCASAGRGVAATAPRCHRLAPPPPRAVGGRPTTAPPRRASQQPAAVCGGHRARGRARDPLLLPSPQLPTPPGPAAAAWSGRRPAARQRQKHARRPGRGRGRRLRRAAAPHCHLPVQRASFRAALGIFYFCTPPPDTARPYRHRTPGPTPHARADTALNKSQKYNCNDAFDSETFASILVFDNDHLRITVTRHEDNCRVAFVGDNDHLRIIVTRHEDNGLVAFVVDHNDSVPSDFIPCVLRH